jgi:hypothetical protein
MPVSIGWVEADVVLLATFSGHVTIQEYDEAIKPFVSPIVNAVASVQVIIDWGEVTEPAVQADILYTVLRALHDKNLGWIALVGYKEVFWYWIAALYEAVPFRIKLFPNVEAAAEFLHHANAPPTAPNEGQ